MFETKVLSAVKGTAAYSSEIKLMAALAKKLGAIYKKPIQVPLADFVLILGQLGFTAEKASEVVPHFEGVYMCARPPWFDVFGFSHSTYLRFRPYYTTDRKAELAGFQVTLEKF